jgi:indoleamine 2,3-dioxygenase
VDELPQQLAIPWYEVSTRCGLPPVATYAAVVLWNWCLKDESMPPTLDNLKTVFSFSGTRSEEWFYLIPLAMELSAIPGIKATVDCFDAMRKGNTIDVIANLKVVCEVIKNMTTILQKMYDECIPDVFYQVFRKFQAGTKNLKKAFSNGLVFEGVDKEPKSHGGASAGQSSILPVFDILLDVQHSGSAKEFLDLQRWHMPRQHRQFLLYLSQQRSLKEFVMQNMTNKSLLDTYNKCVGDLVHFRSQHIILVSRYIVTPAQKYSTSKGDDNLATRGTGGSDFMIFLKTVRDNTANNHISD